MKGKKEERGREKREKDRRSWPTSMSVSSEQDVPTPPQDDTL